MQLVEIAYFTGKVKEMTKFYKAFLGLEPVAQSEGMAIFVNEGVKILVHKNYIPGEGDLPPENHPAYDVDRPVLFVKHSKPQVGR
jgi:catechol 2,3-dioxygenase-like lactoylglutathione lyase family enzyme